MSLAGFICSYRGIREFMRLKTTNFKSAMLRRSLYCILGAFSTMATSQELRIEHVQVSSPERASVLRDATVEIRDGRIAAISSASGTYHRFGHSSRIKVVDG